MPWPQNVAGEGKMVVHKQEPTVAWFGSLVPSYVYSFGPRHAPSRAPPRLSLSLQRVEAVCVDQGNPLASAFDPLLVSVGQSLKETLQEVIPGKQEQLRKLVCTLFVFCYSKPIILSEN